MRSWRALTLPLRLCTLKAMLGDMSRSSDSCSDSFFFSLSMALLPLFALCGERPHGHISIPGARATCSPPIPSPLLPEPSSAYRVCGAVGQEWGVWSCRPGGGGPPSCSAHLSQASLNQSPTFW